MQSLQISNDSSEICVFLITLDEFLLPSVREMNQHDDITCQVARERIYVLMKVFEMMHNDNLILKRAQNETPFE